MVMWVLAILGVVPFLIGGVGVLSGHRVPVVDLDLLAMTLSYGAVIAAFMSGVQWGAVVYRSVRPGVVIVVLSNVLTLLAWGAVLVLPVVYGLWLQAAVFLAILSIDGWLYQQGVITAGYWRLRLCVTSVVVLCLLGLIGWI